MINKYFEWNIDGIQASTVLEGAEITLPIDKSNYKDIFINKDILELLNKCESYIKAVFNSSDKKLNESLLEEFHLSYLISIDNLHYIDFDYCEIFNNVLKKLGIDNSNLKDFGTKKEYETFIKDVENAINKSKGTSDNKNIEIIKESLGKNVKNLLDVLLITGRNGIVEYYYGRQVREEIEFRRNHKTLKNITEKHISWKNLMYYTACKALDEFVLTGDIAYYRYAKNYYKNVAMNPNVEYPKGITVTGTDYDHGHAVFNGRFLAIQSHCFPPHLVRLDIEEKERITRRETLKTGKGMVGTIPASTPKKYKKLDYSKINESLGRKIKYYKGLNARCQGVIDGLKGDTDYIGFVLDNNYVVFDKFYETSKDGTKVNPAYGNRVYIATLDVLEACNYDKSKIRDYIDKNHDYKALKYNHTWNDSYQFKVDRVLRFHDVSTIKFKELKLKNEKKQNN